MTIFAILLPHPQPSLVEAIQKLFPDDHLSITETQWLVSSAGTVVDLTAKLGIYDVKSPGAPATGIAVILAVSSYYGRAPTTVWDWLKTKMEAPARG